MFWKEALKIGVILSIPYGLGHWMVYQAEKFSENYAIPTGSFTGKYGFYIATILKGICYLSLVYYFFKFKCIIILAIPAMWFCSGKIADFIERRLYANRTLDSFERNAKRISELFGEGKRDRERAVRSWETHVPKWWVNAMSSSWKIEYKKRVGKHLKTADPTSILFDREQFEALRNEEKEL